MQASVDIGTNTTLLLVARVNDAGLEVLREEQRVPRLGTGVDKEKQLSDSAMQRVIEVLQEYQELVNRKFPSVSSIRVTATSAVRDAKNRDQFLKRIKEKTGLQVEVLSGFEEAQYTYLGALSILQDDIARRPNLVIDIGGGSTEIAVGSNREIEDRYSFDMGCVRFTERFLQGDPPTGMQVKACRKAIREILQEYEFTFDKDSQLIGVAGTVTSLAYIDKQLTSYSSHALAGHNMSRKHIDNFIRDIRQWPSQKLRDRYPVVMDGRADIFLAGLLILEGFMKEYGFDELITSTGGIRHGVLLAEK